MEDSIIQIVAKQAVEAKKKLAAAKIQAKEKI